VLSVAGQNPLSSAMPPRKKISAADSQLSLGIKDSELSAAFVCKGIFSANYLHQHFGKSGDFPKLDDVRPIYEKIKNRWLEEFAGLRTRKEAYTRTEFLDPVLKEIGWTFIPEQELPSGVTRKRPDYCLFLDDEARQRAAKETEAADVFREAATALMMSAKNHSTAKPNSKVICESGFSTCLKTWQMVSAIIPPMESPPTSR
jgi:hypothetical protein